MSPDTLTDLRAAAGIRDEILLEDLDPVEPRRRDRLELLPEVWPEIENCGDEPVLQWRYPREDVDAFTSV